MKQLTCEMCGSTELLKQDGVFVCQTCGTKYSVEEAKKMMIEGTVEVTGKVEVSGTVQVDESKQLNNYLELSDSAYKQKNGETALLYADKALETNAESVNAWKAKMKAVSLLATDEEPKFDEIIAAGEKAIKLTDEESDKIEVYEFYLDQACNAINRAKEKMSDLSYARTCITRHIADSNAMKAMYYDDKNNYHGKYRKLADGAYRLTRNVPSEYLTNGGLFYMYTLCRNCNEEYVNAYYRRMSVINFDNKGAFFNNNTSAMDKRIESIREEKKKQSKELYWSAHMEEKKQLEAEKAELSSKADVLQSQVNEIDDANRSKINELNNQKNAPVPAREEYDKKTNEIRELENQRNSLGIFKGKEKKALQERIDALRSEKNEIEKEIEPQERARNREINEKIDAIKAQGKDQRMELETIRNRIAEIDRELTMDR